MKKCPKCKEEVSCKKWMYCSKMCRKCDYKYRIKPQREKLKK